MIVVYLAAALLLPSAAAVAAVLLWRRLHRERVLVTLKSGAQYEGLMMSRTFTLVTLGTAIMYPPGSDDMVPIDGEVHLERREIYAYQTGYQTDHRET